jgi:two-component system LytT family response regulator
MGSPHTGAGPIIPAKARTARAPSLCPLNVPTHDAGRYGMRVLIVDDEELARLRLRRLLERETDVTVVGECGRGDEAIDFIRAQAPDVVFLDIQMKDIDGFGVVDELEARAAPFFIFVTAYDRYAVRAFDSNALDYLLKPFSDERLRRALERARARLLQHQISTVSDRLLSLLQTYRPAGATTAFAAADEPAGREEPEMRPLDRLVLKTGGRLLFMDVDRVDWIEAEGVYVRLHTGTRSHLLRESLTNVEKRLDPARFIRIHRSTIVNADRIREIVPHFNGGAIVVLQDGTRLKLSRGYRERVTATLG